MRWSNRERGWRRHAGVLAALAAAAILLAAAQAPPAPTSAAHRFVVVIDAAHGGEDAGGRLGTQAEKNITLAVRLKLRSLLAGHKGRRFRVPEFKEWTGISRKYAIPLLELLDRERLTRREGDERVVL